jgi:hypothetical protein
MIGEFTERRGRGMGEEPECQLKTHARTEIGLNLPSSFNIKIELEFKVCRW